MPGITKKDAEEWCAKTRKLLGGAVSPGQLKNTLAQLNNVKRPDGATDEEWAPIAALLARIQEIAGGLPQNVPGKKKQGVKSEVKGELGTLFKQYEQGVAKVQEAVGLRKEDDAQHGKARALDGLKQGLSEEDARIFEGLDEAGEDALATLTRSFPSPAEAAAFCKSWGGPKAALALLNGPFKGNVKDLQAASAAAKPAEHEAFLRESGLAAKPECLAQAFTSASKGAKPGEKGASLKAWLDSMKTEGPKMKALLGKEGGLGDQPEVFGQFLRVGCGQDPQQLKALLGALEPADLDRLNILVSAGGFAAVPAKDGQEVKPECLGQLFKLGCQGDPATLKQTLGSLSGEEGLPALKGLMESGGLGAHPEALGGTLRSFVSEEMRVAGVPLTEQAKKEAQARGAAKLGKVAASLDTPADRQGFAALLRSGGLAANPDALGGLFQTGCDSDPAQLKALVGAYPAPDPAKVQQGDATALAQQKALADLGGVMGSGGLDQSPEVLGHLLKTGCDRDPANLKTFAAAFSDDPKRAQLKSLLEKGGLGGQAGERPETLGRVLKTALPGRPENLLLLEGAFTAAPKNLKSIFDAFNTAPPPDPDPGVRLKTVLTNLDRNLLQGGTAAARDASNIGRLNTVFFRQLDLQSRSTATINIPGQGATAKNEMALPELIHASASFERTPFPGSPPMPLPLGQDDAGTEAHFKGKLKTAADRAEKAVADHQKAASVQPDAKKALTEATTAVAKARLVSARVTQAFAKSSQRDTKAQDFRAAAFDYDGNRTTFNSNQQAKAGTQLVNANNQLASARTDLGSAVTEAKTGATAARTSAARAAVEAEKQRTEAALQDAGLPAALAEVQRRTEAVQQEQQAVTEAEASAAEPIAAAQRARAAATQAAQYATQAAQVKPDPKNAAAVQKAAGDLKSSQAEAARLEQIALQAEAAAKNASAPVEQARARLVQATGALDVAQKQLTAKRDAATASKDKADAMAAAAQAADAAASEAEQAAAEAATALVGFDCRDVGTPDFAHFCGRHTRAHFTFANAELANQAQVENDLNSNSNNTRKFGKRKAKKTTLFPEGTKPEDLATYLSETLALLSAAGTLPTYAGREQGRGVAARDHTSPPKDFITRELALPKAGYTVKVGFEFNPATFKFDVTQFFPTASTRGDLETIMFWDMHAVKRAIT